jgi:predicted RNA-binding protein with PUA-like domain
MAFWILKTEPSTYSYKDLVSEGKAVWDGVTNPLALKHLRSMRKGDELLIYHTGDEKALVGLASVATAPYADPGDSRLTVVDIKPLKPLQRTVSLSEIRAVPALKDLALVRMPRLSVVPADERQWKALLALASRQAAAHA